MVSMKPVQASPDQNQYDVYVNSYVPKNGYYEYVMPKSAFDSGADYTSIEFKMQVTYALPTSTHPDLAVRFSATNGSTELVTSSDCYPLTSNAVGTYFFTFSNTLHYADIPSFGIVLYFTTVHSCSSNSPIYNDPSEFRIYGHDSGSGFVPYMVWNGNDPGVTAVTIGTPHNGDYLSSDQLATFIGLCPINGTDRLMFFTNYYGQSSSTATLLNCVGNAWSYLIAPRVGANSYTIVDSSFFFGATATNTASVDIVGYGGSYAYGMDILYPPAASGYGMNNFSLRASTNFPFRVGYTVPTSTSAIDIEFDAGCSSDYTGCSSSSTNNLAAMDVDDNGYFDTSFVVVDGTRRYYRFVMYEGSSLKYVINYSTIESDASGTPEAIMPPGNEANCGFWGINFCYLIVPRKRATNAFTEDLPAQLRAKVPFVYYYTMRDAITGATATTSSSSLSQFNIDLDVPMPMLNATYTVPLMSFDWVSDPRFVSIRDTINPFLILAMWGMLGLGIYERIIHMQL